LTDRQIERLTARFAHVCIAFDGDDAGLSGAERTAARLRTSGVKTRVARLPDGADINSLLVQGMTRGKFEHLFETRQS
jgi:DNA primase